MLLPHALTLARARSSLAALADQASSIDASSAYEHVLIELDRIHADDSPAIHSDGTSADRATCSPARRTRSRNSSDAASIH
ncbi:hypothetical protein H4N58_08740 [Mumia sp. ZJ1417]|uniref:hypothetical protein n=1 Tax=Mumia sp. ZJ1417 TaxID=2708082 RepID=UPI0015FDEED7|nr:hypothetical protein [Mumia sp. ZJ1417]QMW67916.1 hypothetical protein H4N58_08740 [Mumia sp. ZJ1417]